MRGTAGRRRARGRRRCRAPRGRPLWPGRRIGDKRRRMCTVVVLIRPGHAGRSCSLPTAMRRLDRAWDPPAAHWPDQPERDRRPGPLRRRHLDGREPARRGRRRAEPAGQPRARGRQAQPRRTAAAGAGARRSAGAASAAIAALDAGDWRSFNLVLADRGGAIFVRGLGHGRPRGGAARTRPAHGHRARPRRSGQPPRRPAPAPVPGRAAARARRLASWRAILADGSGQPGEQINVVAARRLRHRLLVAAGPAAGGAAAVAVRRRPAARGAVSPVPDSLPPDRPARAWRL